MEEKDTTYSSFWLFRKKRTLWKGTDPMAKIKDFRSVRGKNFSEFNPTVAENIINFWSEEGDIILDPFAGRTRALISTLKNRRYIGFEISKEAYNVNNNIIYENIEGEMIPKLFNDDSFNIDKYSIPKVDMIFTCPPYHNIEKYESLDGQLSDIKDYNEFLERYKLILGKSCNLLKENKYLAIVVGDFRKRGKYYHFHSDTIRVLEEIGLKLHDVVVIQSVSFDIANKRFGGLKKYKMTSKVHEYLLVFKKNAI